MVRLLRLSAASKQKSAQRHREDNYNFPTGNHVLLPQVPPLENSCLAKYSPYATEHFLQRAPAAASRPNLDPEFRRPHFKASQPCNRRFTKGETT